MQYLYANKFARGALQETTFQSFKPFGSGSVWSRSLTAFEMTDYFSLSFRAYREKSFFGSQDGLFKLNHHRPFKTFKPAPRIKSGASSLSSPASRRVARED